MDEAIVIWVNQTLAHPYADTLFIWLSQRISFALPVALIILAALLWRYRVNGLKLWLLLLLTISCGDALGNYIKHTVTSARPCYDIYESVRQPLTQSTAPCNGKSSAMPSNHTLNFMAAASFISLILRIPIVTFSLFLIAGLVAFSRLYLAMHYPSQILAGAAIGCLIGYIFAQLSVKCLPFIQSIRQRPNNRSL